MFTKEHIKSKITYCGKNLGAKEIKCTTEEDFISVICARRDTIEQKYWRCERYPNRVDIGLYINGSQEKCFLSIRTMRYDIVDVVMELFEGISVTGFSVCIDDIKAIIVDCKTRAEMINRARNIEAEVDKVIFKR